MLLEESPNGFTAGSIKIEGYTPKQIAYHAALLIQGGLAEGSLDEKGTLDDPSPIVLLNNLKLPGHKFADAARNDSIWNKTKKKIQEQQGPVYLEVLIQVLESFAEREMGL